jgi:hypothetical protein
MANPVIALINVQLRAFLWSIWHNVPDVGQMAGDLIVRGVKQQREGGYHLKMLLITSMCSEK